MKNYENGEFMVYFTRRKFMIFEFRSQDSQIHPDVSHFSFISLFFYLNLLSFSFVILFWNFD